MSNQLDQNPNRVSFNPKGLDVAALDEIAAERDISRAELIREELQQVVEDATAADAEAADLHKPDDPELREAFETLLDLSAHPLGPRSVGVEEAVDRLYSQRCPKSAVKTRLLRPLADLGVISVSTGSITVHRRTVESVEQAESEADDALDRLDRSGFISLTPDRDEEHKQLVKYQRAGLNVPFRLAAWVAGQVLWTGDDHPETGEIPATNQGQKRGVADD